MEDGGEEEGRREEGRRDGGGEWRSKGRVEEEQELP